MPHTLPSNLCTPLKNFALKLNTSTILRISTAALILPHGIAKLSHGTAFISQMLTKAGLPASLAPLVLIGEIVAPLMLIIGFQSAIAGAILAINMLFAITLVHSDQLFSLSNTGGLALELQYLYLILSLLISIDALKSTPTPTTAP